MSSSLKSRRPGFVATLLIVGAVLGVNSSSALATHVSCGDTITQSTTLDSDLLGCQGDGVLIGADNITLDLGGHTIEGNNFNDGVDNEGHPGVTIRNGTVRLFYSGVAIYDTTGNHIHDMTLAHNSAEAITVYDSSNNLVENNTVLSGTSGIGVEDGHGNLILDNSITGQGLGVGIYLFPFSSGNLVARNSVRNMQYGSLLFQADQNVISRNTFTDVGGGMWLLGSEGSDGNQLVRNVTSLTSSDGILISPGSRNNLIQRNQADQNRDDGIDVNDPAATLTKNSTNNNGDWGIEAAPGVTDGGGNTASGNGQAAQCLNVNCK